MQKSSNFYKQIFRATSLFGSSQVLQLIFQVFSNKIIAVLLGPIGIGILGFFNNIIQLIITCTSFDITKTATREIALLSDNDKDFLKKTTQKHFEFALLISIFASLVSVFFAKSFSLLIFNDQSKAYWFYCLPIYFVFFLIAQTRLAILQGLRATKTFATMQVFHVILSGISAVSFYYFWKLDGILWAIIVNGFLLFLLSYYFTYNYSKGLSFQISSFWQSFQDSKTMLYFGLVLSINAIVGQLCFLGIRSFLEMQSHSLEIVGYYEVSQVFLIKYLGMVFIAMSYDYYPKLTHLISDLPSAFKLVNQQIEMAILIILPAALFLYTFGPLVIKLLYSENFIQTFEILQFGLMALALKAFSYPLGFVALAIGHKKLFFKQELIADLLNLLLSIQFFYWFGLKGLGLAMMINYLCYAFYVYYMLHQQFQFRLTKTNIIFFSLLILCCLTSILIIYLNLSIFLNLTLFAMVFLFSIKMIYSKIRT